MNIIIHFIDIINVLKLSYIIPDRIICKIKILIKNSYLPTKK